MDLFTALADPTRRKIIEMLAASGPLSAREIYARFPVSPPAVSQHLKILREARLVSVEKRAQQRIYRVNPQALLQVEGWAGQQAQLWNQRFDALDRLLAAEQTTITSNERISLMQNQSIRELSLTRVFAAPRERVFKAWTDAGLLAQWWGPRYFTTPVCELDVRPGGKIYLEMADPDGARYPMQGVFDEVIPPERLVYTAGAVRDAGGDFALETRTTVTFAELGGQTQLTLHVVVTRATAEAAGPLSGMREGWSQSLDKLAEFLATAKP